jgi:uncharacterized protein
LGILTEEMRRVVEEQRLGFAATVCPDGTPNLSPKGTTAVWDDGRLAFADIRSPRTVENLRRNPAIEVNVVDPISRKGYRFKGTGEVITERDLFDKAVEFYRERGTANPIRAVVLVEVERALPLTSPAYDLGATEEEVRGRWERRHEAISRAGSARQRPSDTVRPTHSSFLDKQTVCLSVRIPGDGKGADESGSEGRDSLGARGRRPTTVHGAWVRGDPHGGNHKWRWRIERRPLPPLQGQGGAVPDCLRGG